MHKTMPRAVYICPERQNQAQTVENILHYIMYEWSVTINCVKNNMVHPCLSNYY
jgi:hypothetical protein